MLTEEQLAAVIDGVKGVARFILVGDPRQLPPIGAGRPFVDIVNRVRPDELDSDASRDGAGCAELTVPRRPTRIAGRETNQAQRRADLMLAEWFSGREPSPASDVIWDRLARRRCRRHAHRPPLGWPRRPSRDRCSRSSRRSWSSSRRTTCSGSSSPAAARSTRAARTSGGRRAASPARLPRSRTGRSSRRCEATRTASATSTASCSANSAQTRSSGRSRAYRKIPKPLGGEEILWGDKVISVVNESWRRVYPKEDALRYIANGDIGVVVGQYKTKGMKGRHGRARSSSPARRATSTTTSTATSARSRRRRWSSPTR